MKLTFPSFDESELELLSRCLDSGWVTQGPFTARFEELVAGVQQVRHASATTSCTAALHLSMLALGIGPGDEVIVPAFTWITSANCAEYPGARAVFVDVDPDTYNIDPERIEDAITPRTRAIVAVHLFGLAAPMDEILRIAGRHGLAVVEDAACAIGTTYHGRPVGGLGDLGCFSFHPRKVITTGEGGMVVTNDATLAERVGSLRNHGLTGSEGVPGNPKPYDMGRFDMLGLNLRLSDIQGAVGVAQMAKLPALLDERRAAAKNYTELLSDIDGLFPPVAGDVRGHSFQSYVIRIGLEGRARRNHIMERLAEQEIQTRPGTHAVHMQGFYRNKYNISPDAFPVAASCEATTITLPIFPGITMQDQERVCAVIREAIAEDL